MIKINWTWKKFADLSVHDLHDLLKLRQDVFIVEQNCVYTDIDGIDERAWHLLGVNDQTLIACARIIPAIQQQQVSIGRVITSQEIRGHGIGRQVMQHCLEFSEKHYPDTKVKISAQQHLELFYAEFGFVKTSEPYDDCGIMHIDMISLNDS